MGKVRKDENEREERKTSKSPLRSFRRIASVFVSLSDLTPHDPLIGRERATQTKDEKERKIGGKEQKQKKGKQRTKEAEA